MTAKMVIFPSTDRKNNKVGKKTPFPTPQEGLEESRPEKLLKYFREAVLLVLRIWHARRESLQNLGFSHSTRFRTFAKKIRALCSNRRTLIC